MRLKGIGGAKGGCGPIKETSLKYRTDIFDFTIALWPVQRPVVSMAKRCWKRTPLRFVIHFGAFASEPFEVVKGMDVAGQSRKRRRHGDADRRCHGIFFAMRLHFVAQRFNLWGRLWKLANAKGIGNQIRFDDGCQIGTATIGHRLRFTGLNYAANHSC